MEGNPPALRSSLIKHRGIGGFRRRRRKPTCPPQPRAPIRSRRRTKQLQPAALPAGSSAARTPLSQPGSAPALGRIRTAPHRHAALARPAPQPGASPSRWTKDGRAPSRPKRKNGGVRETASRGLALRGTFRAKHRFSSLPASLCPAAETDGREPTVSTATGGGPTKASSPPPPPPRGPGRPRRPTHPTAG